MKVYWTFPDSEGIIEVCDCKNPNKIYGSDGIMCTNCHFFILEEVEKPSGISNDNS